MRGQREGSDTQDEEDVQRALIAGYWTGMQGGRKSDTQDAEDVKRPLSPHALSHDPPQQLSGYKGQHLV
jgi:hypothetical protein